MDNDHPVHRSLLCIPYLTTVVHECDCMQQFDVVILVAGVIPHIHKSLIGKKGSQKPA